MTSAFPTGGQAPADHVLIRCMLGGATDPSATTLSDAELIGHGQGALRGLLGITAVPRFTHVARWGRAIPQYLVGHEERVTTIEARGAPLGIHATGCALRGVGVNDVVREARALASRIGP
jgi:oxygen-dependent protoporphyrinogen oxidase